MVHERQVPLAHLEGKQAAVALDILAPEAKNPAAGDDPRQQEAKTEIKQQKTPEEIRAELRSNLLDKACSMLLTKDFDSLADRRVVIQSLVQLSRKEKAYLNIPSPMNLISEVYEEAMRRTFRTRLANAQSLSRSVLEPVVSYSRLKSFDYGLMGYKKISGCNSIERETGKDIEYLKELEKAAPFSQYTLECHGFPFYFAQMLRLFFGIIFEKVYFYIFLMSAYLNPYYVDCVGAAFWIDADLRNPGNAAKTTCLLNYTYYHCMIAFFVLITLEAWNQTRNAKNKRPSAAILVARMMFHAYDMCCVFCYYHGVVFTTSQGDTMQRIVGISTLLIVFHLLWNAYWVFYKQDYAYCFDLLNAIKQFSCICLGDEENVPPYKPTQSEYHCRQLDPECKPQVACTMFFGLKDIVPTVFSNCSHNEKISMDGRVGKELPMHKSIETSKGVLKAWKHLIRTVEPLVSLIERSDQPMEFDDWASTFPPSRKRELTRVRTNNKDMPELLAKSFIKKEISPKDPSDFSFKDPRFIQGCPLELSVAVGPTLRPWTKTIVRTLAPNAGTSREVLEGKQIYYTCGRSNDEIGDLLSKAASVVGEAAPAGAEIVYLEDDQSRFDLHLTEGPFRFLKSVYRRKLPRKIARLLERKVSMGVSSLGTAYKIPFTMQSGWPDTSVGDTLVNAAMKHFIHGTGRPWVSIICGDDSVTVTTRDEIDRLGGLSGIVAKYAEFGMEVEASLTSDPLKVGFCSGRFFPVGDSFVLFPKTGRLISKIGCDMKRRNHRDQLAWARGITSTLEYYGRIDPVLRALGSSFRAQLGVGAELFDHEWEGKSSNKYVRETTWMDICTYYDSAYGMSEADVNAAILEASRCKLGRLACGPMLNRMGIADL